MTPEDPRHGENRGYVAGCREQCCRQAHMVWMKRYRMGGARMVPALPTHRRIQALAAIGWSTGIQARMLGHNRRYIQRVLVVDAVWASTAEAVAGLYDRLSMTVPIDSLTTNAAHKRTRAWAASMGWAVPLAWDDINDPNEIPAGSHVPRCLKDNRLIDEYDRAVVERILSGDYMVPATTAERRDVVARWPHSLNDLERATGWNVARYMEKESA